MGRRNYRLPLKPELATLGHGICKLYVHNSRFLPVRLPPRGRSGLELALLDSLQLGGSEENPTVLLLCDQFLPPKWVFEMLRRMSLLVVALFWTTSFCQQDGNQPPQSRPGGGVPPVVPENHSGQRRQDLAPVQARADLVLVPVVVTKVGKHVADLPKEAFGIEENGKVRNISVFEQVKTESITVDKRSRPEGYSNFLPGNEQVWRVTAVVLDMINTPWMRQREAKQQLTEYLLHNASRQEPMAIFGLNSSGLHQLHPFSTDTKVLIAALEKLKLSLSSEEATQPPEAMTDDPAEEQQASDEEQLMSDFMQDLSDSVAANYQRNAIRQTLVGMKQIAHAVEGVPGRKTLLWASAGFPFTIDDPQSFARQGDDMQTEYQETWRALNSANIAVYPVDLSGMDFSTRQLPSANTGLSSRQINNVRGVNGMKSAVNLPYDKSMQQEMSLHAFADATGGRACITVEELERCFAEAVDDSRAYYLLGYYLAADSQPGWRKLKVKVSGDGLRIRYRSGFYVSPSVQESATLRRQQLADALSSPVQYSGLRLAARLQQQPPSEPLSTTAQPKRTAEFMLEVVGSSLTIDRANGNAIDLEVVTLALDSRHKSISNSAQAIATTLKPENLQRTLQTGIGIPEKVELPPGDYEVKFAVRDNLSGRLGTLSVPVELK
jgi:VWFA-related protein